MNGIPQRLIKYFWDTKAESLDKEKHQTYIIERLLEHGDVDSINWLNKNYSEGEIKKTLKTSKRISPKTGNYFALYYDLSKDKLACMRKPFI
jgi:hypothetical protein